MSQGKENLPISYSYVTLAMLNIVMYYTLPNFYPVKQCSYPVVSKYLFSIRVGNSVDPDPKPTDLDLQCFQKKVNSGSEGQGFIFQIFQEIENLFITQIQCMYVCI